MRARVPVWIGVWLGIALSGIVSLQAATPEPASSAASPQRKLLNQYCVACHNEKIKTANLMLDKLDVENVPVGAEVWEKVIRKLRTGAMPPAGMPRPDKSAYDSLATYLETSLDRAAETKPNPGRPAVHRLNRTEYSNAIRDLLAINIDASSLLPGDDSGYGFDNIGDVLTVSPMLLERYMSAADKISRLAVGDPSLHSVVETYSLPKGLVQEDRMSDDLPFGSRGGIAIRHFFPLDGEYVIQIRLQRDKLEFIMGLADRHQLDVRLDGERIKLFSIGGELKGKGKLENPDQQPYDRIADANLEVRVSAKAGTRLIGVTFLKDAVKPEGIIQRGRNKAFFEGIGSVTVIGPYDAKGPGDTPSRRKIFVCNPQIRAALRQAQGRERSRTATERERSGNNDEQTCAKKILSSLAHRAYRRPVNEADLQPLLGLYNAGRKKGGFEAGIEMALRGVLVSTGFLFRVERDPVSQAAAASDASYRIGDLELASRLSFFLWSSIPDDELLGLAERGKLKDPAVLEQQVRRMLADSRAKALVTNFAGQWLYLRNVSAVHPDPDEYPSFDENLRQAFRQETQLFFESMVREDHSVLDLLNADYTFVNERLAEHYQIPNIFGNDFQRVTLSDENRRGLLGQGSILTVTSYATRTAPTLRGKWLLENILGTPPPPPPPNVPSLKDTSDTKVLTMRQRMEQHRANPVCASCHSRMDPLGFALENFDAIGQWRTTTGTAKAPIDSSGALPDGTKFQGPAELRKILLSHPEQFVTTVTEKLLTYALGRGVEYYDQPAIRKIVRGAASSDYRWSSLIFGIIQSTPFQMRKPAEATTAAALSEPRP